MTNLRENLIQILWEKNSHIWNMILEHINIFSQEELHQIHLIIHQTDIDKLKELFLYQNSQAKAILDRIINLAHEMTHIEKHIEKEKSSSNETELEQYIEQNLELNYVIS